MLWRGGKKSRNPVHCCISEASLNSHAVNNYNNKNEHGNVKPQENTL